MSVTAQLCVSWDSNTPLPILKVLDGREGNSFTNITKALSCGKSVTSKVGLGSRHVMSSVTRYVSYFGNQGDDRCVLYYIDQCHAV